MKLFTFLSLLFLFPSLPSANAETSDWMEKKIKAGDWNLNGGAFFSYSSDEKIAAQIAASVHYFSFDKFSWGIDTNLSHYSSISSLGIGPSATYYFAEQERGVFYVTQKVFYSLIDRAGFASTSSVGGRTGLGYKYFFAPNIAFGPELFYEYHRKTDSLANKSGLLLNFSLYF